MIQVLLDTVAARRPLARRTWMVEAGGAAAPSLALGPGGVGGRGAPRSRERRGGGGGGAGAVSLARGRGGWVGGASPRSRRRGGLSGESLGASCATAPRRR